MKRSRRVLLPPRFAVRLPAADQRRLEQLQAGLVAHLEATELDDPDREDPWQATADLAQWYLVVATESIAASVSVDTDRCTFMLGEAARHGVRPCPRSVTALQRQWLASSRWPCLPGDDEPPLLRGG
ncbi:MAG: hypothetical protein KDK70_17660 [Myxococcales bacterium]|nr:hypothetical protein [Myxococcales bacterium]